MYLKRLILTDFKNIRCADVTFSSKVNCFLGRNGAGKTNLLDAVHYLSMTRSYFGQSDQYAIRFDAPYFSLSGSYLFDDAPGEQIVCVTEASGTKSIKRNDKSYERFSEHIGLLPLVMISPLDTLLIHSAAEERRRFLNVLLSQIDVTYLSLLQQYNKILSQRNHYLKQKAFTAQMTETFDIQLSSRAALIYEKRAALCCLLGPQAERYYSILSGQKEEVSLSYCSDLEHYPLEIKLRDSFDRDQMLGFTSFGIHRDEVALMLNGKPVRKFGSQGQQKTFLLALKLAQFEVMKLRCGLAPILLLDDLFDRLDANRVYRLMQLVTQDHFGQVFITDCNKAGIEESLCAFSPEYLLFDVENGEIKEKKRGSYEA
ncbi:MAG: DNA replication and repair protein RecF [Prevotellaceae bacterium]|jgi:DNA replication and repair protein RecF|nr:DNA replication and repair protein RecF [Prevotellaceae bacterium]